MVSQNVGKVIELLGIVYQIHRQVTIEDTTNNLDFTPISPITTWVIVLNEVQSSYTITVKAFGANFLSLHCSRATLMAISSV